MITIRRFQDFDKRFADECYDFSASFYGRDPYDFNSIVGLPIFIVHKGNKDIGMFINYVNHFSGEVVCEFYKHPRSCSFALASILKVGIIRSTLLVLQDSDSYFGIRTRDALSARIAGRLVPPISTAKLDDNMYYLYINNSLINKNKIKISSDYFPFSELDKEDLVFSIDI